MSPAEEAEYQRLGISLGITKPPVAAAEEPMGLLGFSGRTAANILPSALEKMVQPMQSLLSGGLPIEKGAGDIPRFFDMPEAQGGAQKFIAGAGELASYLPALIGTEVGAAGLLEGAGSKLAMMEAGGMAPLTAARAAQVAKVAKVGGAAAGFGLPMANHGTEDVLTQGAVGGIQSAAADFGWRGKVAAGLIGGGIGYAEGSKQSPMTGAVMGGLNLAIPTMIDPAVKAIFGAKAAGAAAGKASEAGVSPAQVASNPPGTIPFKLREEVPQAPPGMQLATTPPPAQNPGIPFYEAPAPLDIGGGRPIIGQTMPSIPAPLAVQRAAGLGSFGPVPEVASGIQTGAEAYGGQLGIGDAFAGLQKTGGRTLAPDIQLGAQTGEAAYGRQLEVPDIFGGVEKRGGRTLAPDIELGPQSGEMAYGRQLDVPDAFSGVAGKEVASLQVPEVAPEIPTTPVPSVFPPRVKFAPGAAAPELSREGAHVISTAVKRGGKLHLGEKPYEFHDAIGLQHGLTDGTTSVPEGERGFLVRNGDGTIGFANRKRAGKIAYDAKQIAEKTEALKSEDLRPQLDSTVAHVETPAAGLKEGDVSMHWTDDSMPIDVRVTKVTPDHVEYEATDFLTGEVSKKVATPQEFQMLEKLPNERPVAQIPKQSTKTLTEELATTQDMDRLKAIARQVGVPEEEIVRGETSYGQDWIRSLAEQKLNPPKPVEPAASVEPVVKKGKDFLTDGTWDVTVGQRKFSLFRDPDTGYWYDASRNADHGPYAGLLSTETRKDAIQKWLAENPEAVEKVASLQEYVKIDGRFGSELARIVGREGDTLHLEIEDPIFGNRQQSVLAKDTRPVQAKDVPTPKGGVPFQDIESAKLIGKDGIKGMAWSGENPTEMLGSQMEGSGPAAIRTSIPGRNKGILTIQEGLDKLPAEAGSLIGEILQRLQVAAGKEIDTHFSYKMPGAKGGAYLGSGRIGMNIQWVHSMTENWGKMSEISKAKAVMRVAATFGHEITHIAQAYGERSGLAFGGKPLLEALNEKVASMSLSQREYVVRQLIEAKGDNPSAGVIAYLAGDQDAIYKWYSIRRPGMTKADAVNLASGEFMAEIGSTELAKRMNVSGLPEPLRQMIDKFKQVLTNVLNWFKGNGALGDVAAMQDLSNMANVMLDHFGASTDSALGKAFPASEKWLAPKIPSPFASGTLPASHPPITPVTAHNIFLKGELARLGVRVAVGAGLGAALPKLTDNQISTTEGMLIGGVAGLFGPPLVKKIISDGFAKEVADAVKAGGKNPVKILGHLAGGGKSLTELGAEGRFGWTGQASAAAKWVRMLEREMSLNLDPKLKALIQEGKGAVQEQLAIVQDAMNKVRWFSVGPTLEKATEEYFTGKISRTQFEALLTDDKTKLYGSFATTIREATTSLSQMFANGLPKGSLRDHVIKTSETYIARHYNAYKEGKFDMSHFAAVKKDLMARFPEYSPDMADSILQEHMREVQANRGIFGRRENSGQKIDSALTFRRLATEEEIETQRVVVSGLEHNPYSPAYQAEKAKLDWMTEHPITDNWRAWLGEVKSPIDRMTYTFQKIHASAISSKVFDMLDNRIDSNGLKFAYSTADLNQARELLEHEASKLAAGSPELASLQKKLTELSQFGQLPAGSAYGKLQYKWVNRFVRDEINTYDTPFKWMEQPILRGIAQFNNVVKLERTALNPLTVIRNYFQMPAFMLISKTRAGDVGDAFNIIHRGKDAELLGLMRRRGIIGADYVAAELTKGPGHISSGFLDADIATKLAKFGLDKALEFYQQPDMLVRAGAFLGARRRFAALQVEKTGMALADALNHPEVIDKATTFTERYTMNYGAVPRLVKAGRQLPFVNLFISYTSEMTRILNNLRQDIINPHIDSAGRMHAIGVLGAMVAVPAMMTAVAEGNLSKKDNEDWQKVKKLQPSYSRARFMIPTHRDKEGRFHYFDITNMLPADNYSEMIKAFSQGDLAAFAEANPLISLQNTPLLNIAAEQIAGQDLRTGRKIQGMDRAAEVLKEILPPIIPPGYEGQRVSRALSENKDGGLGLTNLRTGVQTLPSDIIANYMTGMRFGNVQLGTLQKQAVSQAKQEIAQQQMLMRDVTQQNVGPQEITQARNRYSEAVKQIMLQLHERLQP